MIATMIFYFLRSSMFINEEI